jgi:hypothetical protein
MKKESNTLMIKWLKKGRSILAGWFNYFFNRDKYYRMIRKPICLGCDLVKGKKFIPYCGVCGCPLDGLTSSPYEKCKHPKGAKW